jgi:hypothetical protein
VIGIGMQVQDWILPKRIRDVDAKERQYSQRYALLQSHHGILPPLELNSVTLDASRRRNRLESSL